MVLKPGAGELARSDTARTRRPKGVVAWFQYQVSKYKTAEPAEGHALPLRRASLVRELKGGTGDYDIGWKRPSKSPTVPRPNLLWMGGDAHPSPSKSPSIPVQSPSKTPLDGQSGSGDDDGTSRNWTAACQLGPRVPIVGACHVSHMRWRAAERAFGRVGHAARSHRHWKSKWI